MNSNFTLAAMRAIDALVGARNRIDELDKLVEMSRSNYTKKLIEEAITELSKFIPYSAKAGGMSEQKWPSRRYIKTLATDFTYAESFNAHSRAITSEETEYLSLAEHQALVAEREAEIERLRKSPNDMSESELDAALRAEGIEPEEAVEEVRYAFNRAQQIIDQQSELDALKDQLAVAARAIRNAPRFWAGDRDGDVCAYCRATNIDDDGSDGHFENCEWLVALAQLTKASGETGDREGGDLP